MSHTILFIHGAGGDAYDLDGKLVQSLQQGLGDDYHIIYPRMPDGNDPNYEKWKQQIVHELSALKDPVILAGHSLGASVLLKVLSENTVTQPIEGIFLAATPFWDESVRMFMLRDDFGAHVPDVPIYLYQGRNDETVPFDHVNLYAKALPKATVRALDGRDHQLNDDLSEMAADIRALA